MGVGGHQDKKEDMAHFTLYHQAGPTIWLLLPLNLH